MEELDSIVNEGPLDISIVIPAYNEEAGISASLTQVINFMSNYSFKEDSTSKSLPATYEIIVVDDGSKDSTVAKVEEYSRYHPEITLIKNNHMGKGFTVRTGMLAAKGKYILMADADMATPIDELKRLMVWMLDHDYDVVIGSREGVGASRKNEPFIRHLMGRVFNFIVQLFALRGIRDSQCGFKLFPHDIAQNVFSKLVIYGKEAKELDRAYLGAFDVEVLYLTKKFNYKIKEVPIAWHYVTTTRINHLKDSIAMFMDVVRVRYNDIQGKYK